MKILVLASTLDLTYRLGCTPAWWQLLKALRELDHEVIAVPYLGDPIETIWWRTYDNPCSRESKIMNRVTARRSSQINGKAGASKAVSRALIKGHVRPKWRKHLHRILEKEKDVDLVLMLNIPVNHISGLPEEIKARYGVKVAYYDGDMPTVLPKYVVDRGFKFDYYDDAELGEYDAFFTNSKGVIPDLEAMGAQNVHPLYWAADPDLFQPFDIEQDYDVSFYGHGDQMREEWMTKLITEPSRTLTDRRFVVGGKDFTIDLGRVDRVGTVPYATFNQFICRSKININTTRTSHTTVYASSTARPFELAAYGACIVSQPYNGIEEWFDIGKDLVVVESAKEACEVYTSLLDDEEARLAMGKRARAAILQRHTYRHRAEELLRVVS